MTKHLGLSAALSVLGLMSACGQPEPYLGFEDGEACGPCGLGVYAYKPSARCIVPFEEDAQVLDSSAQCEGPQTQALFVDTDRGEDRAGSGGKDAPLKSLQFALEQAQARGLRVVVVRGESPSPGPITLFDGVHILGGYKRASYPTLEGMTTTDWYYTPDHRHVLMVEAAQAQATVGVDASDLEQLTLLSNLKIQTTDSMSGENIGVRALRAKSLILKRLIIEAGAGAHGEDGEDGAPGDDGDSGKTGGVGEPHLPGAAGLNASCPEANGGAGGSGQIKTAQEDIAARAGNASAQGVMGGEPRVRGADGKEGEAGQPGRMASAGEFVAGRWLSGMPALKGEEGEAGQGGGGGGGGEVLSGTGRGGGGGGGGAGGCGGEGGAPGTSGYPSVALLVENANVTLVDGSTLKAGQGGDAGKGGLGGDPGEGKRGGGGGGGTSLDNLGAGGGKGAAGGRGGKGGDGVAGPSFGAYCVDQGSLSTQGANNTLSPSLGGREVDGSSRAMSQETSGCTLGQ